MNRKTIILQHVDLFLSTASVNNGRCWVMTVNGNTGMAFSTLSNR
jgi:lipoprotein signal peptidase